MFTGFFIFSISQLMRKQKDEKKKIIKWKNLQMREKEKIIKREKSEKMKFNKTN